MTGRRWWVWPLVLTLLNVLAEIVLRLRLQSNGDWIGSVAAWGFVTYFWGLVWILRRRSRGG